MDLTPVMSTPSLTASNSPSARFRSVWILTDGKMGDLIQCRGIASALGVEAEERIIEPRKPWVWFMPWGPVPPGDRPDQAGSPIAYPLPDLVIASGRRTVAYLRLIKRASCGKTFAVYLKDPRIRGEFIDLIWVPQHDRRTGANVFETLASPHRYSPRRLAEEFGALPDELGSLPRPLVSVLLGGDSKGFSFQKEDCERLAAQLRLLADQGAGLAITPSRRTPDILANAIREQLAGSVHYWWDGSGDNPYGYLLAHADCTIVTADSTNMVMEACVTGRAVHYFRPAGLSKKKIDRMLEGLTQYGAVRPLPAQVAELDNWTYQPIYAAEEIAAAIITRANDDHARTRGA